MTKAGIVKQIQSSAGISKEESVALFESMLSIMKEALISGEKIKYAGFGNFEVREKKEHNGRNPQTGEQLTIEARKTITFKPSNVLRSAINGDKA